MTQRGVIFITLGRALIRSREARHDNFIYSVALTPSGSHMAVGAVDKTVYLHDLSLRMATRQLHHQGLIQV